MKLPEEFNEIISSIFYDKLVDIYSSNEEIGEELDAIRVKGEIKEKEISCNVHQIGNEVAKEEYGLNIEANIMVTCNNTTANIGDILTYENEDYSITGKLKPDTHIKLFAKLGGI